MITGQRKVSKFGGTLCSCIHYLEDGQFQYHKNSIDENSCCSWSSEKGKNNMIRYYFGLTSRLITKIAKMYTLKFLKVTGRNVSKFGGTL